MKIHLVSAAMAALFAAPAFAQPPETAAAPKASITVEGVDPAEVLGAIDPTKLVDSDAPAATAQSEPPANKPLVLSQTTVAETPTATIEQTTETIVPISDRPALNPENPIAPEVQAVVETKKHYTTADLANAQLAAVLATPASEPTTTITTTRTTPKSDG